MSPNTSQLVTTVSNYRRNLPKSKKQIQKSTKRQHCCYYILTSSTVICSWSDIRNRKYENLHFQRTIQHQSTPLLKKSGRKCVILCPKTAFRRGNYFTFAPPPPLAIPESCAHNKGLIGKSMIGATRCCGDPDKNWSTYQSLNWNLDLINFSKILGSLDVPIRLME